MLIRYYINIYYLLILQLQLIKSNQIDSNIKIMIYEIESSIMKNIQEYIDVHTESIETIRKFVETNKQQHLSSFKSNDYNQISVYSDIRRFLSWPTLDEIYVLNEDWTIRLAELADDFKIMRKYDIITTSIETFYWLQDVYKLSTNSLADGVINGIQYNTELSSIDCYVLGDVAFKHKDYYHAILWLNITIHKLDKYIYQDKLKSSLELIAESYNKLGNRESAAQYSDILIELFPSSKAYNLNQMYKVIPSNMTRYNEVFNDLREHEYNRMIENQSWTYTALCREDQLNNPLKLDHSLYCHYVNNNIPFLFIAPLKKEIFHLDPLLVMFHDVINNEEIIAIQKLVVDNMDISRISDGVVDFYIRSGRDMHMPYSNKTLLDILKRTGDITKLNMNSTEYFNVKYYEIGEQYGPHHDTHSYSICSEDKLHRLSTLMFYLNDVRQGGATVFPALNITVWPRKGSAIFWYNLHPTGILDKRTIHAGCPVLVGKKWVATVWNQFYDQQFHWPCLKSS